MTQPVFRILLLAGYVLLPFTSLPILPSDYRPISVAAFAVTGAIVIGRRFARGTLTWDEGVLVMFIVACAFQTLALVGVVYGNYAGGVRHLAVLVLGVLSYVSLKQIFREYGIEPALRLLAGVYLVILAVGIIEVLCLFHVLPGGVKWWLNMILAGRSVDRVQLVTSEASWGAKTLLFAFPLLGYLWYRSRRRVYLAGLIVALVLFGFTLSLEGFLTALLAIALFALFQFRRIVARPGWVAAAIAAVVVVGGVFYASFRLFPEGRQYYLARLRILERFQYDQIRDLPRTDTSVFIRLYYPWLGVRMFADRPWGVGLGGYPLHFKDYLDRLGIDYHDFPEVRGDLRTCTADPRSLYAKILAENGFYSGWILAVFGGIHLYYLNRPPRGRIIQYRTLRIAFFAVILAILVQFGTYAYLPMWWVLALNAESAWAPVEEPAGS